MTSWRLEDVTLSDVREQQYQVAILPMGATEPHNLHLPYGTDSYEAWHLADLCCQRATELGGKVVQLPVMPYGTESNLQAFPLAMNVQPTTLFLVLRAAKPARRTASRCGIRSAPARCGFRNLHREVRRDAFLRSGARG